jgi:hypothetical protein
MDAVHEPAAAGDDIAAPAPTVAPAEAQDPSHVLLHVPVNVRSMSLIVIAVIASLATLRWASGFFIPVMIGFLLSYALSPVVDGLERIHVPRALSAAVLIIGIIAGSGAALYSFSDDANQLVASLPQATRKLRESLHLHIGRGDSTLGTVQQAAAQLEQAAKEAGPSAPAGRGVQHVVIEKPTFDVREHLWSGTIGLASLIGQVTVVTFLTYFLLLSGDTFRRKLVKIAGPSFATKKITVQALDEITAQIQRYLLVQVLASILVLGARPQSRGRLGLRRRRAEHGAVCRLGHHHRRRGAGSVRAVRRGAQCGRPRRRFAADPRRGGQPAGALVDQPREPDEPGRRVHRRARLGLVVGRLGPAAGHPHPDGGQGRLRSRGPPQPGRGTAGRVGRPRRQPVLRSAAEIPLIAMWMPWRASSSALPAR